MLKVLIKKELAQLNQYLFYSKKKKTLRSKKELVGAIVLYVFLFVIVGASLGALDTLFGAAFVSDGVGLDWLYFAMGGMIALVLGVFGDVFNTYNSLYKSKDNDLLLSLPIRPSMILISKMVGVFLMGLLYESLAFIPLCVVYWIMGSFTIRGFLCELIIWLALGVFIAALTSVLGWVIAWITSKFKGNKKSIFTTLFTLVFLGLYYVVYFRAVNSLQSIFDHVDDIKNFFSSNMAFFARMGFGAAGHFGSLVTFVGVVVAFFVLVYYVMSRSYIKLITTNKGAKKVQYKKQASKVNSPMGAMIKKELKHFVATSVYTLNAGLGLILMIVAAVVLLIKMNDARVLLSAVSEISASIPWVINAVPAVVLVATMLIGSMNAISAPSVSLEGKNIWILQSCPVDGKKVLASKLLTHVILCSVPTVVLVLTGSFVLQLGFVNGLLILLAALAYVVLIGLAGVVLDTERVNLSWTNEVVPVKQGFAFTVVFFGGWGATVAVAGLFFLTRNILNAGTFIGLILVLLCIADYLLYRRMTGKTAAKFCCLS